MSPAMTNSPDPVTAHVIEVGEALSTRLAELATQMRQVLAERIVELRGDPTLTELLGASVESNIDNFLYALQHDIRGERLEPPSAAYEYARRLAQRGVPVSALVRAYRLGQQFLLRQAFDYSSHSDTPPEIRAAAYDRIANEIFDYIDWISQRIVVVYEGERESWLANRTNSRDAKVREILSSADVEYDAAERALGYRLRKRHVGVIVWVDGKDASADQLGRLSKAVRALAGRLESTAPPLIVGVDQATVWGWIAVEAHYSFDPDMAPLDPVGAGDPASPRFALGAAGVGVDGFRRTHRQAQQVHLMALKGQHPPATIFSYDDHGVALASLLAQDLEATREWVAAVLGNLVVDDEPHQRHRETLLSFLRHEGSFTATAEAMVMHKNSIKYRIASAEKVLGRPLVEDRLSIEAALTVCRWLGSAVLGKDGH